MLRTVVIVFFAMTMIVSGDAAGKVLATDGIAPFFVAWTRFAIAALVLLPLSGLKRTELGMMFHWPILLRAALIACGISCILTALKSEPIANVFGAFFIGPVVSYVLSALLLKEQVTVQRTCLLLFGFVGVLLVVKPGFGATSGLGFAFAAGCFYGGYLVATRWLANCYRPRFLLISQLLIGAVILAPFGLANAPGTLTISISTLVSFSALASAAGNLLLVLESRRTPAGLMAPLIYSQLIAATVIGYLVFREWPDNLSLIGLVIIAGSGFGSLWLSKRAS